MTGARDTDRPLGFLRATRIIFDLALEGMIWSRRSLLMAALLALPPIVAALYRIALLAGRLSHAPAPSDLYGYIVALYDIRNVLPLVALFYATSLVADEVEGKTITYLLTRPIPRPAILVGKFAAYLATGLALSLPATVITFFLFATAPAGPGLAAAAPDLFRDLGAIILTLLAYGALFTLFGVQLRRPVLPGLLYLFGWELIANLPGYMPRLTLTGYLRSLIHHHPPEDTIFPVVAEVLPWGLCLGVLLVTSAVLFAMALWIFSEREYVLDQ